MEVLSFKNLLLLVLLVIFQLETKAQNKIKIIDCNLFYPISNVMLINSSGQTIAESDSLGEVNMDLLNKFQKLNLYKQGYKIAVYQGNNTDSIFCLFSEAYAIDEVTIRNKQFNYLKLLRQLVAQSEVAFSDDTVTTYYSFKYTAIIRESQLQFEASGILKVLLNPYSKWLFAIADSVLFCSLDYKVDSSVWKIEKLKNMKVLDPLLFIWHDPMRKRKFLRTLPKRKMFVSVKNENGLNFYIKDSLKGNTVVYFNADSSIRSFYQNEIRENYLLYEDTICYNNLEQRYFSYRMFKSAMKTDLGIVDYEISLKSIEKEKVHNNPCRIHYGATFKPVEYIEKYDIGLEIK